ncbi:cysteine hydrolase [Candidatus Woesearchaeota archaeon]|jgi:nicotinamidase-related amidase|nr:cysteine hydrolase [Candidatus Woesearchaeota archaeon]MBT5272895.1 cysteine hydrolase [Candidatus Woesearchaeota archaeon]MBT6041361.1 cysteine hydrolase [Candidatus Woesearchaeota archaeon]MBT6337244.1 cysteine hydrolase [Candidatus Woesearchaeota archaeon]MBT7927121.1 cysteine hydrolase [Candidatus Woesearchaeota archaeon]
MTNETALFVIDMQNDFVEKDSLIEVKEIRENIPKFKKFLKDCRKKGYLIVHTRHCYDPKKNPIEAKLFSELRGGGLRRKTHGWEIYKELKPEKGEIVIDKTRYDAFFKTDLEKILKKNKIKKIIITGTMTNICCESTARGGMYRDFEIIFCSDLTFSRNKQKQEGTLVTIKSHFGKVMSSKEIINL